MAGRKVKTRSGTAQKALGSSIKREIRSSLKESADNRITERMPKYRKKCIDNILSGKVPYMRLWQNIAVDTPVRPAQKN